jgi:hypothetical protein
MRVSDIPWKVQQYCYFWIASDTMPAAEIARALDLEPDRASVKGSKRTEPRPVPVQHRWEIVCDRHGPIDEQATELLERIKAVAQVVRSLVDEGNVEAGLMMVRYFDDPDGGDAAMGWYLSSEQIRLIAAMGANIQADEHGR